MVLQFLCPNGHKVHCSEERAGQPAKCPRCGIKFRIPSIEELQLTDATDSATGSSMKVGSASGSQSTVSGIGSGGATGPDQIEFLCPNDHLLHGPASLQDRPGRCPECGSRFRIPVYSDQPETIPSPETAMPDPFRGNSSRHAGEASNSSTWQTKPEFHAAEVSNVGSAAVDAAATALATANLVSRLWAWKSEGATIELRYGDGHRLTPDQFVQSLTTPRHGVFAVAESNGTFTLTAIAWESIQVVIARGVRHLPE